MKFFIYAVCFVVGLWLVTAQNNDVNLTMWEPVMQDIRDIISEDRSWGPFFVRLAFLSSATYNPRLNRSEYQFGSFGGTIRYRPERDYQLNKGVMVAMDKLHPIYHEYMEFLSLADLFTLAGAVAISELGGPNITWTPGRKDAPDNSFCAPEENLPKAELENVTRAGQQRGFENTRMIFRRMGFSDREMVALMGGRGLGSAHENRTGYNGSTTDSPLEFSNKYFIFLQNRTWTLMEVMPAGNSTEENQTEILHEYKSGDFTMLPADISLKNDVRFMQYVSRYAANESLFMEDFKAAFEKLLNLGLNQNICVYSRPMKEAETNSTTSQE
jgi:catalase (peroxidase I)